jgi:hypothetical protein
LHRLKEREFGKWVFLEITDPWNTKTEIRKFLESIVVKLFKTTQGNE